MVIFKGEAVFVLSLCSLGSLALRHKGREKNKMKETEVDSFCVVMICVCVHVQ